MSGFDFKFFQRHILFTASEQQVLPVQSTGIFRRPQQVRASGHRRRALFETSVTVDANVDRKTALLPCADGMMVPSYRLG